MMKCVSPKGREFQWKSLLVLKNILIAHYRYFRGTAIKLIVYVPFSSEKDKGMKVTTANERCVRNINIAFSFY